jgi:beta-glucanase (GH16 family)
VRLAGILLLLILVSGCTPPPSAPAQQWRLVWGDEFDGRAVDRSKWTIRNGEGRDVDLGCNVDDPANSYIRYGFLVIRGLRETVRCGSQTRHYTQAYLDTIGRFAWTYGRFEIRARAPSDGTGIWPAFWLRPEDGGKGEIDVVELPGGTKWQGKATTAIFYDYTPVKQDARFPLGGDGFHTYVTEWTPTSLTWFIDGQQVWRRDSSTTPFFDEVFHKPYNLRLNLQVGGWLGAPGAATAFPAEFVVDHVRVYQRSPIVTP